MIQLILFTIAFLIFLAWNWLIIEKLNISPRHGIQQLIRTIVWLALAILIQPDWRDKIMYFIAYHGAFGLPFNILLNLMRGKAWNYIGLEEDPEEDAWTDKIGREWPAAFWGVYFMGFLIGMGTLIFGTYW